MKIATLTCQQIAELCCLHIQSLPEEVIEVLDDVTDVYLYTESECVLLLHKPEAIPVDIRDHGLYAAQLLQDSFLHHQEPLVTKHASFTQWLIFSNILQKFFNYFRIK